MEIKDTLIIAKEFTKTPGARYLKDGSKYSGETFLKDFLKPRFEKAVAGNYILKIVLDGVMGYPSSFVSGSFGKLSLEKSSALVLKHIIFESDDNPLRKEKIIFEIKNPQKK
ncbi:MAG TPA: DUF4325 domain-containing protein [Bacteroidales bacterium]|nr:DUF4325 domain-containing protein [Bacteroidales bacterium]